MKRNVKLNCINNKEIILKKKGLIQASALALFRFNSSTNKKRYVFFKYYRANLIFQLIHLQQLPTIRSVFPKILFEYVRAL